MLAYKLKTAIAGMINMKIITITSIKFEELNKCA